MISVKTEVLKGLNSFDLKFIKQYGKKNVVETDKVKIYSWSLDCYGIYDSCYKITVLKTAVRYKLYRVAYSPL